MERSEDLLKERSSRKNKKKAKDTEKASVISQIEQRLLVLPFEASLIAIFLLVLLGVILNLILPAEHYVWRSGLVLLWNDPYDIKISSYSCGHIDCIVTLEQNVWRFTGFYGNPITSSRIFSWKLLSRLNNIPELQHLPWLVGGDFNEILYESEKVGGSLRSLSQMSAFRDVINLCMLSDLNFIGEQFTWCNKRKNNEIIFERLDRFFCNSDWQLMYPEAVVSHLDFFSSDHRLISVRLKKGCDMFFRKGPKRFMFEHKWMMEEDFSLIMEQWMYFDNLTNLPNILFKFSGVLQIWAASRFSEMPRKIDSIRKELNELLNPHLAIKNFDRISKLENNLEKMAVQEEMHWKQRARTNWLTYGDGNTKFFHSFASQRNRINHIKGLNDDNGNWFVAEKDIANIILKFFSNMFSSTNPSVMDIEAATLNILPLVDDSMNDILGAPYTENDIYKALFDMHPSKAPGPDGFTALFFQKNWSIVGQKVVAACLNVLNNKGDLTEWNATTITLIPKVSVPMNPKDFRPISLCNTSYKIVARAITNRLRPILAKVIDPHQSAFVPGRLITDNVILGYECMHWIRNNKKNKTGFGALKLDMSKAYDRVEWNFLQQMMIKLGFAKDFVELIIRCISSVDYSIRINNAIYGKLKPQRGLRQGDPLSSYLFAICAQGLSTILSQAEQRKWFQGIKIASQCPSISHLFFADDSLIFFRALPSECFHIRKCLQIYEKASGQLVNYEKSAISFSPSASSFNISTIQSIFSIEVVKGHELYLGLPTFSLRSKRIQFAGLRERILKKINGWASKFFSAGGKETLIKSVLQAIPSYAMSCFKLPISLCNELEQCCAKFWWNTKSAGGSMHWIKWRKMCKPKQYGGMGFRSLQEFNRALLAKQVWRIIHDPSSLMAQILKARYFKNDDIMNAQLGYNPSYVWRSILWSRDLIKKGLLWRVGNGFCIKAFSDSWIPKLASGTSSLSSLNDSTLVHELISTDRTWNEDKIRNIFPSFEANYILEIPLTNHDSDDIRFWKWGKKGHYSVKSGYLLEMGCFDPLESQSTYFLEYWWKMIWKIQIPQKVKIFLWRASKDLLSTEGNLFQRHIHASGSCFFCGSPTATTCHSLFFCPKVRTMWKDTLFWPCLKKCKLLPFISCCLSVKDYYSTSEFEQFVMLSWATWKEICKLKHTAPISNTDIRVNWVFSYLEHFKNARSVLRASIEVAPIDRIDKWKSPPLGHLRLDVDAGFIESLGIFSAGAVLRNHLGLICAASSSRLISSVSVVDAEIQAIHFGIMLALRCDAHNVWIFSDSVCAVKELNSNIVGLNHQGVLVSNILNLLESGRFRGL